MRILVTGCLGFIGSHFVKELIYYNTEYSSIKIRGFSRNTSQRSLKRLHGVPIHEMIYGDLTGDISGICEDVDVIVNFAAKTFVDHSIRDPQPFIESNVVGTYNLLEQARAYKPKLFLQVSTDEVYGSILEGAYKEDAPLNPTNPYSSAKASADMLVVSYGNTYNLPYIITRTENNYGFFQHPQKVFPKFVQMALQGDPLPVYGDGKHRRMWLRVEDHCRAIWHLIQWALAKDYPVKEIFHIAGEQELENLELARRILKILDRPEDQINFIDDFNIRPGHDRRYALNVDKLQSTGWKPAYGLDEGIEEVVQWYRNNPEWRV